MLSHVGDSVVQRALEQLEAIRMVLCDDRNSSHLVP